MSASWKRNGCTVAAGNLVEDADFKYAWDFENRLRELRDSNTDEPVSESWYDTDNRRIKKLADERATVYFDDGMHEVQESDCFAAANIAAEGIGSGTARLLDAGRGPRCAQ